MAQVETKVLTAIEQEEQRNRLTREALADVDAENVIDHQAVQAWAESLGADIPAGEPADWRKV